MRSVRITLPPHLSAANLRLVLKYFETARRMSAGKESSRGHSGFTGQGTDCLCPGSPLSQAGPAHD